HNNLTSAKSRNCPPQFQFTSHQKQPQKPERRREYSHPRLACHVFSHTFSPQPPSTRSDPLSHFSPIEPLRSSGARSTPRPKRRRHDLGPPGPGGARSGRWRCPRGRRSGPGRGQ
ncbi:hypothetical protein PanWU01x14_240300, partial [Parasponia andersonii]